MKLLLRFALRNLARSRRRTALMVVLVALSTWAIICFWGLTEGFMQTMIDAQVQLEAADLQIHRTGYLEDPDLHRFLTESDLQTAANAVARHPEMLALSSRIRFEGLLKSAYGATGVEIRGVDPANETRVTQLERALVDGSFLQARGQIILGRRLASDLDIRLGERVVLEAQGLEKNLTRTLRLVGVFSTGLVLLDRSTVFVSIEDAEILAGFNGATEIAIALKKGSAPARVAEALRSDLLSDYTVSTFFELNPLLAEFIKVQSIEMIPWMIILALLAGFGVANTVMFTVMERTREFGVLMGLGMRPTRIGLLVVLESLCASALGFAIGGLVGYALNEYLARVGIDLGFYAETFPDMGMPHIVYASNSGWYWLYGLSVVALTALVAAWYPARRAAALEPTEAIRRL